MSAIDQVIAMLTTPRRRKPVRPPSGARMLMPSAGSGGSTGTRHTGGGSSTPSPGISDFPSVGGGGGRSRSTGGAPSVTIPASSSSGYPVPSTVPAANAISPQRLAALLPAPRAASILATNKPQPRINTLLDQLDRKFKPGETLTSRQAALLAEAYGLPGRTYAQIGKGESGLEPAAVGHDPGGTVGRGWLQMTPGVQSPETVAKWNQIARQHPGGYSNPVAQVEMAKVLAGGGTGVSNYYGTGFVTDPNAHVQGGQQRAQRILGMPASGQASGGPYAYPFGGNIQIGRTDMGIDPSGPGPIRAIGRAKYLGMGGSGWPTEGGSGEGPVYKLLQGPQAGKRVYTYEGITPRSDLQPGDILHKGEPIARSTGSSFETGYAQGRAAGFQPVADPHYSEGDVTQEGSAFRKFVTSLGGRGGSYPTQIGGASYGMPSSGGSVSSVLSALGGSTSGTAPSSRRATNMLSQLLGIGGGGGGSFSGGQPPVSSSLLSPTKPQPRTASARQDQQGQSQDDQQKLLELLASLGYA